MSPHMMQERGLAAPAPSHTPAMCMDYQFVEEAFKEGVKTAFHVLMDNLSGNMSEEEAKEKFKKAVKNASKARELAKCALSE